MVVARGEIDRDGEKKKEELRSGVDRFLFLISANGQEKNRH